LSFFSLVSVEGFFSFWVSVAIFEVSVEMVGFLVDYQLGFYLRGCRHHCLQGWR
jgi:hypothetical protein